MIQYPLFLIEIYPNLFRSSLALILYSHSKYVIETNIINSTIVQINDDEKSEMLLVCE